MNTPLERNLGPQPLADIMTQNGLSAHDLVRVSNVPMTHKLIARARKGRRLTANSKKTVIDALNAATSRSYGETDVFTY